MMHNYLTLKLIFISILMICAALSGPLQLHDYKVIVIKLRRL